MARHMVGDDQKVYRVVIVQKSWRHNPDYDGSDPNSRRFIWVDEPGITETYGPYNSLGAARGQLTSLSKDWEGNLLPSVMSTKVQLAHTTWEDVT